MCILYHGGNMILEKPEIHVPSRPLDFGEGFYTTFSREQACRWSSKVYERKQEGRPTLNIYEYSREEALENLKVLKFEKPDVEWLKFIVSNRTSNLNHNFDIVEGPVANERSTRYSWDSKTGSSLWTRRFPVSNRSLWPTRSCSTPLHRCIISDS